MASRGRGRQGGGQNNNEPPPVFDQLAFMEAIGVATATIVQTATDAMKINLAAFQL